jgi:hypothetical protein
MKGIIMKKIYFAILFSLILLFFGCSKEDDKKTNFVRIADNSKLEGTWQTSCIDAGASGYIIYTITISGMTGIYKQEIHSDASCATDYYTLEDTYSSYTVGNTVTYNDDTTGYYLYSVVESFVETPIHSTWVASNNSSSYCGYSGWTANVGYDYTGLTCSGTTKDSKGTEYYSISQLVGTTLKVSGFSKTSYPDTLLGRSYTKQ